MPTTWSMAAIADDGKDWPRRAEGETAAACRRQYLTDMVLTRRRMERRIFLFQECPADIGKHRLLRR